MITRINLMAPDVYAAPYSYYAEMRRHTPVCQVDPGGLWAVTRYDDVVTVLKNPQLFSSAGFRAAVVAPWLPHNPLADSLLFMDPPQHTQMRALLSRAFTPAAMEHLEPTIRTLCEQLASEATARRDVDFIEAFALPVPARVISNLLGLDNSLHSRFKRWSDDIVNVGIVAPDDHQRQEEIRSTIRDMEGYLRGVLADRHLHPRENDMVSHLLQVRVDGQALSDSEVIAFLFLLLIAGLETTVHLLGQSARLMMEHPEVEARLRAERSLIPRFVDEVLRLEPPGYMALRLVTTDTTLGGIQLARGTPIALLIGSANRDEGHFTNPDRLDLDRPGPQNLPFGHGIHFCLGAALARLEARVALDVLLSRCRLLPGREKPQWTYSMNLRGLARLPVEVRST